MESFLQNFEARFSDYTSMDRLSQVNKIEESGIIKYDYTDTYVDDCSITAYYLFDLIRGDDINEDANMEDLLQLLNSNTCFVFLFEYYMVEQEMHTLCLIVEDKNVVVCQSYGGITCANHQNIERGLFTHIMKNFCQNPNALVPIGEYEVEIDVISISKMKDIDNIILTKITPELEQILYDARECYINHRFEEHKPQHDEKYREIVAGADLYDFIINLHKKCAEQGYKISSSYCEPHTYRKKLELMGGDDWDDE